jgi:hypothetical protein
MRARTQQWEDLSLSDDVEQLGDGPRDDAQVLQWWHV